MKYVAAIAVVVLLGVLTVSIASAWTPPAECDDADRATPGNRSTPCRLAFPEAIDNVTYSVEMHYPYCTEELSFEVPGARRSAEDAKISWVWFYPVNLATGSHRGRSRVWTRASEGRVHLQGKSWTSDSSIEGDSSFAPSNAGPLDTAFRVIVSVLTSNGRYDVQSPTAHMPSTDGMVALANSCLDLVRQETQNREHAAAVALEEQESKARIEAQEDADRKAQEQALLEAETQARIAEQELAAALASKARAAKLELVKTQSLENQLKHEEVIASILRDIVRIRLAGQEDRARITNEYLVRWEATVAEFEAETSEVEGRIQQYIDFNAQLLGRIAEYQDSIDSRLAQVESSIQEQRTRIEQINQELEQQSTEAETKDP